MIQSVLANLDSFWFILTQVPGALQAAINIYERYPALAVFACVGVFLGCVAKQGSLGLLGPSSSPAASSEIVHPAAW